MWPETTGRVRAGNRGHGHERRKNAFAEYLSGVNLDSCQIYFVNRIVEYIVKNGVMKALSVLQEPPFTDLSLWAKVKHAIDSISVNAAA